MSREEDWNYLISCLGKELNLTGKEIADVLWLALQRLEQGEGEYGATPESQKKQRTTKKSADNEGTLPVLGKFRDEQHQERKARIYSSSGEAQPDGLPIGIPNAQSLREPLTLLKALHPLMLRTSNGRQTIIDEEATVERIAKQSVGREKPVWLPVLKGEMEPWLDLALVIDESQSMQLWGQTIRELRRLFENYGIFRDIRVWGVKPSQDGHQLELFLRTGSTHRLADTKEIIDPTGRRLVLMVSDCVSNIWRRGLIFPTLKDWTQNQPLALIQLLPAAMWRRTALELGMAVKFKSSGAGMSNHSLQVTPAVPCQNLTKIPVLTLESPMIAQWSQMLLGKGNSSTPGYLLPNQLNLPEHPLLQQQQQAIANLDPTERVQRFVLNTSPLGQKLAGLLAAAPVINLPIVRLIQKTLLPESGQLQVAEVFFGGILQPIKQDTKPEAVEYGFVDHQVRMLLLEEAPVSDSTEVLNAVSDYIAEQMGYSMNEFMALLKAPGPEKTEGIKYFAEIAARILRQLGGSCLQLALQLEQGKNLGEEEVKTPGEKPIIETVYVNSKGEINRREIVNVDYYDEQLENTGAKFPESIRMISIPAGKFWMGSPESEKGRSENESPQHLVTVPTFFMSQTQVTQAQWRVIASLPQEGKELNPDPSRFKGEDLPVERVSWQDAIEFCARLSRHTGRNYRLPSEAEWEYACRAIQSPEQLPTGADQKPIYPPFHFGETITSDLANYDGSVTYQQEPAGEYRKKTTPVRSFHPNAFGLYNMHGNVWEWCLDPWHGDYKTAPTDGRVWDKENNDNRYQDILSNINVLIKDDRTYVLRGGAWIYDPLFCRSASRSSYGSDLINVGFRPVFSFQDSSPLHS